ncbi:MAG: pilus assembly protein TadG-related protein [Planctomycetaceae bacterium]
MLVNRPKPDRTVPQDEPRRGAIFVLSALLMILVFAFAAFAVDMGYITASRTELQKAADAAALGAAIELGEGYGSGAIMTPAQVDTAARNAAVAVAAENRAASIDAVYCDGTRDVRLGNYAYDSATSSWVKTWGAQPYNMVEVTLRRNVAGSGGDRPLDLFFAPVMGTDHANIEVVSRTALIPGNGIDISSGTNQTADVLPIALDIASWINLMAGNGPDNYRYNANGTVTAGSDGIKEVNIYPSGSQNLPPGNRGTVDFGASNNSTADISRQILHGLNQSDLNHFGGKISFDNGPLTINGDTGISAGIKDELEAIKGKPRLMPIFTSVSGPGNNAMYVIPKLVGIRIMYVNLVGKPASKMVVVQPAPFSADVVIPSTNTTISPDSYFVPGGLIP